MYSPRFEVAAFDSLELATQQDLAILRALLEALAAVNLQHIRARRVPRLDVAIRSGMVRYVDPVATKRDDPWRDALLCVRAGEVDCEDLSAWLVAELRAQGRPAEFGLAVGWLPSGQRGVHVFVRSGSQVFDPSKWAGMR